MTDHPASHIEPGTAPTHGVVVQSLTVPPELDGARLDVALAALLPGTTRSAAQRLIDAGGVVLSHGNARPARNVVPGLRITVTLKEQPPAVLVPSHRSLSIIYQDDDLAVIDKPAGLAVHPGAGGEQDTLVHALLGHDPDIAGVGDTTRPGLVHRLDKDTSGLIVVARTPAAHAALARQWHERRVTKGYKALVVGTPRQEEGLIDLPIGRDPRNRKRMAPATDGRPARTSYRLTRSYRGFSLLDVRIETGRTHQIRVHLAAMGHPVAGDDLYGGKRAPPGLTRQFLHAYLLGFHLPSTGAYREFTSPLPPDLDRVLTALEGRA
jgi:23S rRNA pseudouridine1911/1915/1917 synthase